MNALVFSTRAELLRLRKWSAVWVVIGAWLSLALMFGYVFDYIGYRTGSGPAADNLTRRQLLAQLLPSGVPDVLVQGLPLFGAAFALVLGALAAGNGFGWGTWKTAHTQGPGRGTVIGGSLVALTLLLVAIVTATLILCVSVSTGISVSEGASFTWPSLLDVVTSYGAGLLVLEMWALAGYTVAVVARGPALAIGLGVVWLLVVENLLRSIDGILPVLEQLTRVLPGTAAGSLVGAVIGSGAGTNGTPGILTAIAGARALVTVVVYVVVLGGLVLSVVRRRDVA